MAKQLVWLSYDLGLTGDYEGLYTWLDRQEAKECGDSVAIFVYHCDSDLAEHIKQSLEDAVSLDKKSRIYLIYRTDEGRTKGKFLFGRRKAAPWAGYAVADEGGDDIGD